MLASVSTIVSDCAGSCWPRLLSSIDQSIPMFLSNAEFLNETVLEHLVRRRLQVDDEKAVLTFRNVLQELFDLVRRVVARDLFDDRLSLQSVA